MEKDSFSCFYDVDARIIDCKISNKGISFYFSCVYGHPIRPLRHVFWECLQRLSLKRTEPWLLCGDFNKILNANETRGGRRRENWSLADFRNMVKCCKISDLPFQGNNMTWVGKRRNYTVESWLNRAMTADQWKATFPASEVIYLEMVESDHRPAIIKIRRKTEQGIRPFQFDTRLCSNLEFEGVIKQIWNNNLVYGNTSLQECIRNCRREILSWKRNHNTNSAIRIKDIIKEIDVTHSDNSISVEQIRHLRRELIKAYREEETFWKLKSRNQWLNEGDRNTRFFHASTKNRIVRNRLNSIQDINGMTVYGNNDIGSEVVRYFSDLFSESVECPKEYTSSSDP